MRRSILPSLPVSKLVLAAVLVGGASAAAADVVYLRKDCSGFPLTPCHETVGDLGSVWSNASDTNPFTVDVEAGDWGTVQCAGSGHVTFQGAGREHTRLQGVVGSNCQGLGMEDLSVVDGVIWVGNGSSTWSGVDIRGPARGWYDFYCDFQPSGSAPAGRHFFYGSRIEGHQAAIVANCSELSFYGGEVIARFDPEETAGELTAVHVSHRGVVRIYGSAVRAVTLLDADQDGNPDPPIPSSLVTRGVRVGPKGSTGDGSPGYGRFEMSGGIISLSAEGLDPGDVVALSVDQAQVGTASAQVPDTAFAIRPGPGGASTRTVLLAPGPGGGGIGSAFTWEAGTQPPLATGEQAHALQAERGKDLFVEIDCSAVPGVGECDQGAGAQPHLMIYSDTCDTNPGGPWFNVVTGRCRGE